MKPTRNHVFCYGCRKHKMIFETQAKADNFIRYNSEDILEENGKAPVRSYYCQICGGYHVTSNPSSEVGEHLNQRDHQLIQNLIAYKNDIEEVKALSASLSKRLVHIKALLFFGQVNEAEELLDICNLDIEEIGSRPLKGSGKLTTLRGRVEKMYELLASVKGVLSLSEQEQLDYIANPHSDKDETALAIILTNVRVIKEVDVLLEENNVDLAEANIDKVPERLARCQEILPSVQRAGKKEIKAKYTALIDEQQRRYKKLLAAQHLPTVYPPVKEKPNEKQHNTSDTYYKKEYKEKILSLIERLEMIKESFDKGDFDSCETSIEIAYYMFDELDISDNNTSLIKQHLDLWAERQKRL